MGNDKNTKLGAFKDIENLYGPPINKGHDNLARQSEFSLYNFLEREESRLRKIELFCGHKVKTLEDFDQTPTILENQKRMLEAFENSLIDNMLNQNANIHQHLKHIFNKTMKLK